MLRRIICIIAMLLLVGCAAPAPSPSLPSPPPSAVSDVVPTPSSAPAQVQEAVLVAVGDNLIHDVIYQQAQRRATVDEPNFAPLYTRIAPLVADADFAFVNQETVLAGDELPLSSYPLFCSPVQVGEALIDLGFNLFSTANNHSYDKGEAGIAAAGEFWQRQQDIAVAGSYRDAGEREALHTITRGGITVALVAAAEHTNGITLPAGSTAGVLLLADRERLLAQIEAAVAQSDFVVLSLHWGDEDSDTPSDGQRALARELAEAGADLILGHHSHVLQGGEYIPTSRGRSYVAYSLGNLVSAQVRTANLAGGVLRVGLSKGAGRATIDKVSFTPTVTHYGAGFAGLTVYPFASYTPELAAVHGVHRWASSFDHDLLAEQLGKLHW